MKKIFTLMLALFAMVAIQAQSLLSEDFENGIPSTWLNIDADNDGNSWLSSAGISGVTGHNGTDGCAFSCSYYNSTVLTPNNWLITPAVTLTGNATLTFWVAAQDASYAAEHYGVYISTNGGTSTSDFTLLFEETMDANGGARTQGTWKQKTVNLASYTGQTIRIAFRHFNCTDMFYLNLDDVVIFAQPTSPTIIANPTVIDFGNVILGNTATAQSDIQCYNLTAGVTATTAVPFTVSSDGSTYASTATVAATGGTLYVQYAPSTVGADNGTVTLASAGAPDVTITLTGAGLDCGNNPIPYSYSFTDAGANQCWEIIDANNDGYTFSFSAEDSLVYYLYNVSDDADDWLISPAFTLTGNEIGSIDYAAYSSSYPEKFQIFAIGNNDTVALTGVVNATSTDFNTQYFGLNTLTGSYKIGIHCVSDANMWRLLLTNFNVFAGTAPASVTLSTDALDFGTIPVGTTSNTQFVVMNTVSVDEAFTLTTAAPYEISLNGTSFAATQTIPANSALTTTDTIFVRFAPTTVNTFPGTLAITSATYNETVALTGASADCSQGITTFPFVYDFNTGAYPPICWGYNDAENYWAATVDADAGDYAMGISGVDMLVTPQITATNPMAVMFDYRTYLGDNLDGEGTSFRVGYSTTNDNASSFTWLPTVTVNSYPEGDELFFTYAGNVPANAKYVAVDFLAFDTYYGFYEDAIYMDNFRLVTDPYMAVSPESIDFGEIMAGATSTTTVSVTTALLPSDITVTAPANFQVSSNGASFAATATVPAAGGNLYVRYAPTAAGSHSGTVTLTCGSLTKTVSVYGSAVDCSAAHALPYFDGFESGIGGCYRNVDNDGDGYAWADNIYTEWQYEPYDGEGCAMSASYINNVGALNPDNYLITPALAIPSSGAKVSWYVAAQDASYASEYYEVMVSTTPDNLNSFTTIFSETLESADWEARTANIPASFNGQTAYVAFRHHDVTDMFWMKIDNLNVTAGTGIENHESNVTIYPNPAKNVLNINANSNINRVEVYNMMGQMVGYYNANDVNVQINTTNFANGVYTVKIATENGDMTRKFTVAR